MQKAIEIGVYGFEFDIQMSRDGAPVVIHDETLERTTSGSGLVSGYTLEELQKLDAGNGEKIPTLKQVIEFTDKRCNLFIELKAENATKPVADIVKDSVNSMGWIYEQFFVCSFNHLQLVEIRKLNSNIKTCALFVGIPASLAQIAYEVGSFALNPCIHHISKDLVDDAHRRGLKVFTWTADKKREIEKAFAMGVDGIISNFPDMI